MVVLNLIFDDETKFIGILLSVNDKFINEFDLSNEWVGYWVHAQNRTWLRYNLNNNWVGFYKLTLAKLSVFRNLVNIFFIRQNILC